MSAMRREHSQQSKLSKGSKGLTGNPNLRSSVHSQSLSCVSKPVVLNQIHSATASQRFFIDDDVRDDDALSNRIEELLQEKHVQLVDFLDKRLSRMEALMTQKTKVSLRPHRKEREEPLHSTDLLPVFGTEVEPAAMLNHKEGLELPIDAVKKDKQSAFSTPTCSNTVLRSRKLNFEDGSWEMELGGLGEQDLEAAKKMNEKEKEKEEDADGDAQEGDISSDFVRRSRPRMELRLRAAWDAPQSPFSRGSRGKSTRDGNSVYLHRFDTVADLNKSSSPLRHPRSCSALCALLLRITMIPPGSMLQIGWDVLAAMVVMHDIFEVPLQVFEPDEDNDFAVWMRWISQLFWNVDLLVSFRMGYFEKDEPVMSSKKVAHHYIRTWFVFDVLIVSLDWMLYILQEQVQSGAGTSPLIAKAGKTFKIFRAARTLRMLRLMKMRRAFKRIEEHTVHSLAGCTTPLLGIARFVLGILLVNHFLSSTWYVVGTDSGENGWVARHSVRDLEFWHRYLLTFHWGLVQFGVGASIVYPISIYEYLCNIAILLIGLLVTALLVSSITNTFSVMQQQTAEHYHQMWLLRRFCLEKDFPRSLSRRILRHVERQCEDKSNRAEICDVRLLGMLSKPLHAEVVFHVYLPPLSTHPFLRVLCKEAAYTMQHVASNSITELLLAENDLVFVRGSFAKVAFNLLSGTMTYRRDLTSVADGTESEADIRPETIGEKQWISEPVLWVQSWEHIGDLATKSTCTCLALDAQSFTEEVSAQSDTFLLSRQYAIARVEALKECSSLELSDIVAPDTALGLLKGDSESLFEELVLYQSERRRCALNCSWRARLFGICRKRHRRAEG